MGDGTLVLNAAPERRRSNDTYYPYRPSSDVLYLSGFPEPEAVLVLAPHHPEHRFVLFVRPRDTEREIWDGFRYGPEGAVSEFGADAAYPIEELDERLPEYLKGRERVLWPLGQDRRFDERMLGAMNAMRATRKKPDTAPKLVQDPRPLIHRARMRKDSDEIALMARASEVAAEAHLEAMKATRAGKFEYEIAAVIENVFRQHGCSGPAYPSIVAGGAAACVLHYIQNDQALRDGDLLLVDAGGELDWYASDITRTWPVGAAFSGPQRDIYSLVLSAEEAGIDDARVGMTNHELQRRTIRRLTEGMVELGLLEGDVDGLIERDAHKRFYMHGVGHHLGLDVHDVAIYYLEEGVGVPFEAGTVITIEPGIYISPSDEEAPEAFRGIGVRIEDDVVITNTEPLVLTGGAPKAIDEIEALRREHIDG